MHTKRKITPKKIQAAVAILGLAILFLAAFYFYRASEKQLEKRLLKIVNYMKVQCDTYTHYNEGAETQALLRAVESNRQVRDGITTEGKAGNELSEELLSKYAKDLWLYGILVLDPEGNQVLSYARDAQVEKQLLENYSREAVLGGSGYAVRTYSQRIYLDDGGYINMAASARTDAEGVVVTYYYISAECAQSYSLTLQSLLEGYQISTDGTIMVTDVGKVIACNDEELIGEDTSENAVVQILKEKEEGSHLVNIRDAHCFGIMLKQRDYYIYAYATDKLIFSTVLQDVFLVMVAYVCMAGVLGLLLKRSERIHLKQDMEKEQQYKKELLEAAKKADAANVAKTEFLQRMSHDIRTPINGICGMLAVAEYYKDDLEKQAECRAKIKNASHLLLELINEVLDMGKLESGEIVLEEQPFDFHEVLNEVLVVIEKLSSEQGIELVQEEFKVEHWKLIGSSRHVKRLLMNIMSNAVKYNRPYGRITIKCRELPSKQEDIALLEVSCADTGIGMSEEYQKKLFEPFTQENKSIQTQYGGTGLGMSIAKGLVDKMNGTLTFESEEGKGTTFVITLPFRISEEEELEDEETRDSAPASIRGYHVLLVEDNELNMEIAEFLMETEGVVIEKAWNGKEAVECFRKSGIWEFDAILMDVMMPEMDGYQAVGRIRAMDREDAKNIPIIAMTANAFTEDRIKTRKAGMNAHVSKPLDSRLVVETVYHLVRKNRKRLQG